MKPTRRQFLKTTSAGALAASLPSIALGKAAANRKLKIGFIGCGGRGTGATSQALSADENVELYAMGDVFQARIDKAHGVLSKKFSGKVNVPAERQFVGLDAYKKVLNSGVDVVILTSPPGFRPMMFEAAVDAGVHIFCEKPMGTDVPGVKRVLAASKKAQKKGLTVMSGFCWRYSGSRRLAYQQVTDGAIGDVRSVYATYLASPVRRFSENAVKPEQMSDAEWQISNWINFVWLSGDSIVEQAVHSVDKIGWVMGDTQPVACVGMGGREQPNPGAQIFDHFHANFEYSNGVRASITSRQQRGVHNEVGDYIAGATGALTIGRGDPYLQDLDGNRTWRFSNSMETGTVKDMYQQEHNELFASIRNEAGHNDGERMCNSCFMAIMAREAAYTGQRITWDNLMADETSLYPEGLKWDSFLESSDRAIPGVSPLTPTRVAG